MQTALKQFGVKAHKSDGTPAENQLALINRYTNKDASNEDVYVRTAYLANNAIDRDGEVISDQLLANLADTLPGKGLFNKHPRGFDGDSGYGIGRWFEAKVQEMSQDEARAALGNDLRFAPGTDTAKVIEASFYIDRSDDTAGLINKLDYGIAGDVSVGFSFTRREPINDEHQNEVAQLLVGPGEAMEASLVWLGAQRGARVHKDAKRGQQSIFNDDDYDQEDTDMDKLKEAQDKATELQTKLAGFEKLGTLDKIKAAIEHSAVLMKVKTALGIKDDAEIDVEEIKRCYTAGKAYVDSLVNTVITAKRHAGKIKDDDKETQMATEKYLHGLPLSLLEAEAAEAKQALPRNSQFDGGDPNNPQRSTDKDSKIPSLLVA